MSLFVIKAWVDDGPSNHYIVEAKTHVEARNRIVEFDPDASIEFVSLGESYRGFAMLTQPEPLPF